MTATANTATPLHDLVAEALRTPMPGTTTSHARSHARTAIEEVAEHAEASKTSVAAARWRHLLPLSAPRPEDEQYAFEVDLDRCTSCKACVTGCHNANGLDEQEIWRVAGDLRPATGSNIATVTSACHHCLNPECMNGCPVEAYEKDPLTGIVRHLDDQCIGCQYCVLKCPYGVPQYNARLGIVRKCDMCAERLEAGEAPACVQACPNEAIRIIVVDRQETRRRVHRTFGLDDIAPDPGLTLPTTRYRGTRPARPMAPPQPVPEAAHWPLVIMLVTTQLSVGIALAVAAEWTVAPLQRTLLTAALVLTGVGLGVAPLHLGRPLAAIRAVLGITHSWISRELALLGLYFALCGIATLAAWFPPLEARLSAGLLPTAALTGLAGVVASAMIYVDTPRQLWRRGRTMMLFLGTVALGTAAALATDPVHSTIGAALLIALLTVKLAIEGVPIIRSEELEGTRTLLRGPLRRTLLLRGGLATLAMAVAILPLISRGAISGSGLLVMIILGLTGSACLERLLFFRGVVAQRMPGWEAHT